MLKDTTQGRRKYRIAAYNAHLHSNGVCPGNHEVQYHNGWYYLDGDPRQAPDVTRRARECEETPRVEVRFNTTYNTYVLVHVDIDGSVQRGAVSV